MLRETDVRPWETDVQAWQTLTQHGLKQSKLELPDKPVMAASSQPYIRDLESQT